MFSPAATPPWGVPVALSKSRIVTLSSGLGLLGRERGDGEIFHTETERTQLRRLATWGLFDLYRERVPAGRAFSWWDYRGGAFYKNQGLRIDLLLGTAPVLARVGDVIDREYRKKKDVVSVEDHPTSAPPAPAGRRARVLAASRVREAGVPLAGRRRGSRSLL